MRTNAAGLRAGHSEVSKTLLARFDPSVARMNDAIQSATIRVETPDGTMFVIIGSGLSHVEIHIGKAGTALLAWAAALAGVIELAVAKGCSTVEIVHALSGISSDRQATRYLGRSMVKTGPDGVA